VGIVCTERRGLWVVAMGRKRDGAKRPDLRRRGRRPRGCRRGARMAARAWQTATGSTRYLPRAHPRLLATTSAVASGGREEGASPDGFPGTRHSDQVPAGVKRRQRPWRNKVEIFLTGDGNWRRMPRELDGSGWTPL
jgi:hypothetical protein